MKALKLLEYLAVNARYQPSSLQAILAEQDQITIAIYAQKNSEKFRILLNGHNKFPDKTTIFRV